MEWCTYIAIFLSFASIVIVVAKEDDKNTMAAVLPFTLLVTAAFLIAAIKTYNEPQLMKEKAVKAGVGKFVANERGEVKFHFVTKEGSLVDYESIDLKKDDMNSFGTLR